MAPPDTTPPSVEGSPEPVVLDYSTTGQRPSWIRRHWFKLSVVVLLLIGYVAWDRTNSGLHHETSAVCQTCGSTREADVLWFFGLHFEYSARTAKGVIARCLERYDNKACIHQWLSCPWPPSRSNVRNPGWSTLKASRNLFDDLDAEIDRRLKDDPNFSRRLRDHLVNYDLDLVNSLNRLSKTNQEAIAAIRKSQNAHP